MTARDGHVRVLPLHVANKIAAGEVVERPASVVKELVENAIDAGARTVRISLTAGGRKLVAVQDDGCGMSRDDATLSLERQATSKILDVSDIEEIDTLGFRGEAIPSIASVSRFSLTTRRADSDEGTFVLVNAGTLAEVRTAGCPPGTLVEVRDLFCNVPARRKFLRAYATEEGHARAVFTVHALAHPEIAFSLTIDGRETYRLAPAATAAERVGDLFGREFSENLLSLSFEGDVRVTGFIEKPTLATPTRRDQYVFVNGRPASAPVIGAVLREAYPHRPGETRPAVILFLSLPPGQVDVNVHPTKREVRFRDNAAVKNAVRSAIDQALASLGSYPNGRTAERTEPRPETPDTLRAPEKTETPRPTTAFPPSPVPFQRTQEQPVVAKALERQLEFAIEPNSTQSRPWQWFRFLAQTASGYLLLETDAGVVTINPIAARERIVFEKLVGTGSNETHASQTLLIPEIVQLSPVDFARVKAFEDVIGAMGFQLEPFGRDTFKVEAVPQLLGSISPSAVLTTIARDLSESGTRKAGERWREELIARSVAKMFSGAPITLTAEAATRLVEELCTCQMPYICPRGRRVMIFTSTSELDRRFDR